MAEPSDTAPVDPTADEEEEDTESPKPQETAEERTSRIIAELDQVKIRILQKIKLLESGQYPDHRALAENLKETEEWRRAIHYCKIMRELARAKRQKEGGAEAEEDAPEEGGDDDDEEEEDEDEQVDEGAVMRRMYTIQEYGGKLPDESIMQSAEWKEAWRRYNAGLRIEVTLGRHRVVSCLQTDE